MMSARLQRACFHILVSVSIIAFLSLILWLITRSALHAATGQMFSQLQKLTAPDGGANQFFGNSVAIDGDTAVVGASPVGKVYVFVRTGGLWSLQQKLGVEGVAFGISVAISGDTIVVGAFGEDSSTGAAYVFVRAAGVWSQQQRLIASDRIENDNFGISVAASGDTIVVGARFHGAGPHPQQGSAYVFARSGGVWSQQQHLTANDGGVAEFYGDGVAISGDTIVVAAAGIDQNQMLELGSAYVYVRAAGAWSEQQRLTPSGGRANGLFGSSVAINSDTIIVGALFDSAAYVFARSGGVWSQQQKLTVALSEFGISASISDDTIVVGARNENGGQGAAHVFVKMNGVWSEQQTLTASDGADNDRFGNSVSISGDAIIVGSPFDQVGENENQGSAYIFMPNTPPAITASTVTIQQGRAITDASIATVSDNETTASALSVSVVGGTATGITLTDIANIGGAITADVAATCGATGGTLRLRVTDTGGFIAEADLQVNVTANDPPVITCPTNLVMTTTPGTAMVIVSYPPPTATDDCGVMGIACNPPSGSSFPLGTTTVTCIATDTSANTAQCSFTVTLFDVCLQDDSNPARALLLITSGSQAGEYRFCCGIVKTGRGVVTRKGSTFTLTHNTADRRVQATVDNGAARGSALLQSPLGSTPCSITDRNIRDNSCSCITDHE